MVEKEKEVKHTWNNRVVRKRNTLPNGEEFSYYEIHEVHYEDRKAIAMTEGSVSPYGDTLEELKADYKQIAEAFKAPIIEQGDIVKDEEE